MKGIKQSGAATIHSRLRINSKPRMCYATSIPFANVIDALCYEFDFFVLGSVLQLIVTHLVRA